MDGTEYCGSTCLPSRASLAYSFLARAPEKLHNLNTCQSFEFNHDFIQDIRKMAWEEPRKTGMQYRRVGNSGLHVSVLGLGGWLTYVDQLFLPPYIHTDQYCSFGGHVENGSRFYTMLINHLADCHLRTHILHHENRLR
jgi:hypothetical protein